MIELHVAYLQSNAGDGDGHFGGFFDGHGENIWGYSGDGEDYGDGSGDGYGDAIEGESGEDYPLDLVIRDLERL